MVGWHDQLDGHEFKQTLGDGEGQGSLVCCSPWGCKESDMTEQLRTNKLRRSIDSFNTLSVSANYRQSTGLYAVDGVAKSQTRLSD